MGELMKQIVHRSFFFVCTVHFSRSVLLFSGVFLFFSVFLSVPLVLVSFAVVLPSGVCTDFWFFCIPLRIVRSSVWFVCMFLADLHLLLVLWFLRLFACQLSVFQGILVFVSFIFLFSSFVCLCPSPLFCNLSLLL